MKVIGDHFKRGPESTLESRHLKSLDHDVVTPTVNTETPAFGLSKKRNHLIGGNPKDVWLT